MYQKKQSSEKYSTYLESRDKILEILSTNPLNLLLVIVPQICDVPTINNENYRYYSIIQSYTNQAHTNIQDKKASLLLKLWLKELIYKISDRIIISPEDQKIIDIILNKLFNKLKNIHPNQQIKNTLFNKFRKIILKSDVNPELKKLFQSQAVNTLNLIRYTREITSEITSAMNNPDATLLVACHGITKMHSKDSPNAPISQKIRYLYQHIMKIPPINLKTALNLFPRQHIVFSIQSKFLHTRIKLKDYQNRIEKFLRYRYPWYSIINKINQIIHTYIIKPRIMKKIEILKQIEYAFTESVAYGDTVFFFKQLKVTRQDTNISWNPSYKDIKILIRSLNDMEPCTQNIMTTKEFVKNIKLYTKYEHATHHIRNTKRQHLPDNSYIEREQRTENNKPHKSNIIKKTKKVLGYTKHIAKKAPKSLKNTIRKVIHNKKKHTLETLSIPSTSSTSIDSTSAIKSTHTHFSPSI
ncbi:hypothetical protein [Ehrlichia japonica]|uniref:Uncharacterized protein n=1 Tax=Ehrlichia japonica TaxID=391036 RepID=X5GJD0_9RICK|nr:hypothetical protein [Ehrlichia japonica]AHX04528.1 hypothetical protein EHF_0177 [Ehrlichia japonica]